MAKGFVRGRDYTVWFAPDIPVSAGPWKLWGLPGLIVEARSDDGRVYFVLTSLQATAEYPAEPVVEKTVTHDEFRVQYKEAMRLISRRVRAISMGRDVQISVDFPLDKYPDKTLYD
jgi:GLPGLI family protein